MPFAFPRGTQQPYTLKTTSELVLLDVSVKDTKGGAVDGLTKDNFRVYEDTRLQTIESFSPADRPVTLGLLIDKSGSMRARANHVIDAALALVQSSNPEDEVFVVNFNDCVTFGLPDDVAFSSDIPTLRAALSATPPAGRTALYDAIDMGLTHLAEGKRDKKTLVIVSDGGDNASTHTLPDILREIEESRATIYTIGIFDESDRDQNIRLLKKISHISGGETFLPRDAADVPEICKRIASDIRGRYTIGYVPIRAGNAAALRNIKVEAVQPQGPKLVVRARTSYQLPERKEE